MGLFDHLFKPKPDTVGERSGDAAGKPAEAVAQPAGKEEFPPDPSSFLHPKGFSATLDAPASPPVLRATEKRLPISEAPREIVLTLSDVLPRIPPHYLRPELRDEKRELRFDAEALSADIARGRASVPLSTIATLCPDIFQQSADELDDMEIRLPLQKLVEQIGGLRLDLRPPHPVLFGAQAVPAHPVILQPIDPLQGAEPATEPEILRLPADVSTQVVEEARAPKSALIPEQIQLGLAVVLAGVPREMLTGEVPTIDESVRISLPFAAIEPQLPFGKVEVAGRDFLAALPSVLRAHFIERGEVRVTLSMEEIVRNLPSSYVVPVPTSVPSDFEAPAAPEGDASPAPVEPNINEPTNVLEATEAASSEAKNEPETAIKTPLIDLDNGAATSSDAAPSPQYEGEVKAPLASSPAAPATESIKASALTGVSASSPAWLPPVRLFAPPPPLFPLAPVRPESSEKIASSPASEPSPGAESSSLNRIPEPQAPSPAASSVSEESARADAVLPQPSPVEPQPEETAPENQIQAESAAPASPLTAAPELAAPAIRPLVLQRPVLFGHPAPPPGGGVGSPSVSEPDSPPISETPESPTAAAPTPLAEEPPPEPPPPVPAESTPLPTPADVPLAAPKREEKSPSRSHEKTPGNRPELQPEKAPAVEPSGAETERKMPPAQNAAEDFDQENLQALFMTDEPLDLPRISKLAAMLPGVQACVIATRDQAVTGGVLPEGFDISALLGLAPRVGEAAGRLPIGALKHFTLYGEDYSVSFFERDGLCLCAVHRARSFVPGVREKLVALADELAG